MKSGSKLSGVLGLLQDSRPGEDRGTFGVGVKSYNPEGTTCGAEHMFLNICFPHKASVWNGSDGEG